LIEGCHASRFYNRRGTAEQWIKEGKQATHWTRLSCHRFRANEVRLQLSVLAYNVGNLWRRLVLPKKIDHWSLTSLQQRLVKTGGRLVKHARYYWLQLAEPSGNPKRKSRSREGKTTMKTIMRTSIYLPVAAMLLTTALAGAAVAADKLVPFSGSFQGRETDIFQGPPPGTLAVNGSGGGIATHLGQFSLTWQLTVNLANASATGSFTFTAANGDSIFTMISGQAEPTDTPGVVRIVEINTVTGGTGRFEGAKGSFTVDRLLDLNTGLTSGSFHGTITSPGSAK